MERASNFIEFQSFLFQSFTHHNLRFKVNKRVIYMREMYDSLGKRQFFAFSFAYTCTPVLRQKKI